MNTSQVQESYKDTYAEQKKRCCEANVEVKYRKQFLDFRRNTGTRATQIHIHSISTRKSSPTTFTNSMNNLLLLVCSDWNFILNSLSKKNNSSTNILIRNVHKDPIVFLYLFQFNETPHQVGEDTRKTASRKTHHTILKDKNQLRKYHHNEFQVEHLIEKTQI